MPTRKQLILTGFCLFVAFIFFSFLVHKNLMVQMDFNSTVRLQDHVSRRFDDIFSTFSDIGKAEVMTVIFLVVLVFARKIKAGFIALTLYVIFHLIEIYGKFFVDHPPPPQFMLRTKEIIAFPQFHVRSENSYPSGHSGRTLFISVILVILILQSKKFPRELKLLMISGIVIFDITMLVSRVYLGEHWTTDVIGGSILGAAFAFIVGAFLVSNKKEHHSQEKHEDKKSLFPKYKIEIKKVE